MIATIVAVGDSANNWIPRGLTVGVNDVYKWNQKVHTLIVINTPNKFTPERMKFIQMHKGKFLTNNSSWKQFMPQAEILRDMGPFNKRIDKGRIYTSETSPICAISYAMTEGATDIILYGCDMKSHRYYSQGTKRGDHEIQNYLKFFESCRKVNVNIYLGALGTAFDETLPLWKDTAL